MRYLLFFAVFMCLYGPRFKALDLMFSFCVLIALANIAVFVLKRRMPKYLFIATAYLFFLFVLFMLHYFYYGTGDITHLGFIIKYIVYLYSADFIVRSYFKTFNESGFGRLSVDMLNATAINAIFVILMFFFDGFQRYMGNVLDYERQLMWVETGHRTFDLSLGGGALGSFVFSLVFIVAMFIPEKYRGSRYLLGLASVVLATALMGRTGLYIIIIASILFFGYKCRSISLNMNIKSSTLILNFLFFFLFCLGFVLLLFGDLNFDGNYFSWVLEGINGENRTANALREMWFLPDQETSLLLGHGNYGRSEDYLIYSDVGYVRMLHATGILGILVGYSIFFVILFWGLPSVSFSADSEVLKKLLLIMIVMFLIMNLKELHLAARGSTLILFFVFSSIFYSAKYLKERHS